MSSNKKVNNESIKLETVEEALARGIKIERLPSSEEIKQKQIEDGEIEQDNEITVRGRAMTPLDIKNLGDAMDFYGEKIVRKKKKQKPDFSKIDKTQIPKNLHYILESVESSDTPNTEEKRRRNR